MKSATVMMAKAMSHARPAASITAGAGCDGRDGSRSESTGPVGATGAARRHNVYN